jgi:ABC-type glycerol-3-phosphate transport system substrate-binding protein
VLARILAALAAVIALAGCGVFVAPSPTAGEMGDLVSALVLRGVTITDQVSGDAGCSDPSLFGNAIRYDARMAGETATVPIYVLRWNSQQTFDANEPAFQACVAQFQQAHPGVNLLTFEDSPWRVYSAAPSSLLRGAIVEAVTAVAGASPPEEIQ